jgi:hypothetical protein
LIAITASLGIDGLGGEQQAADEVGGVVLHHCGILVEQGLALRAVGNHVFGLNAKFHMGGKASAAGANNAGFTGLVDQTRGHGDTRRRSVSSWRGERGVGTAFEAVRRG